MSENVILEGKALRKRYPVRTGVLMRTVGHLTALDRFDFSIAEGRTLGIVGESGCGKTTLGRLVARIHEGEGSLLYRPRGGESFEANARLPRDRELAFRRDVQMVFQDPFGSLDPRMTIETILREPLAAHGLAGEGKAGRAETRERLAALLGEVGLHPEALGRYPHEFSGGQRQRVAVARALALKPRLIVCDEPTSALDVSVQSQVVNLLSKVQKDQGLAYLFISHNLELVRYVSDRIAVMYLGRAVEEGPAEELFSRPLHPYTEALLESAPSWDPADRRALSLDLKGEPPSPRWTPPGCPFEPRCPKAAEACRGGGAPELREISPGRRAACHFA